MATLWEIGSTHYREAGYVVSHQVGSLRASRDARSRAVSSGLFLYVTRGQGEKIGELEARLADIEAGQNARLVALEAQLTLRDEAGPVSAKRPPGWIPGPQTIASRLELLESLVGYVGGRVEGLEEWAMTMVPKGDATVRVIMPETEDDRQMRRFIERGYKVDISVPPVVTPTIQTRAFPGPITYITMPITLTFTRNGEPVQNVQVSTPSVGGLSGTPPGPGEGRLGFSDQESRRTDANGQLRARLRLRSDGIGGLVAISVSIPTGEDRLLGKAVKTILVQ